MRGHPVFATFTVKGLEFMKSEKNAIPQLAKAYDSLAWMNLTAHLYDLTESVRDGRFGMNGTGLEKEFDGLYGRLLTAIRDYASRGENSRASVLSEMSSLRERIVKRSEQIQVYTDILLIHEYLLNRVEYALTESDQPFDDEEEARDLLRKIFDAKDPAEVNLRIQMMVSQLPVRITKSRFFDLVKEGFSVYSNSDVDALSGFQYRIISAAAMQERPAEAVFLDYERLVDALDKLDTDSLTSEGCNEWQERIDDAAAELNTDADSLLALQECVNAFYTIALLDFDSADIETRNIMLPAVGAVTEFGLSLLAGRNDALSEGALGGAFAYMEGRLEPLSERVLKDEAKVDAYCEHDSAFSESEEGARILLSKKLMSTSVFARLTEQKVVMVTPEKLEEVTADVIGTLSKGMEGRSRGFNRSVMASVLKELPVFFNSHTEVMNYVLQSLHNCSNIGEKRGATAMLRNLLGAGGQEQA